MEWRGLRGSGNVEDRRGLSGGHFAVGGGVLGLIFLLARVFLTGDTSQLQQLPQLNGGAPISAEQKAREDTLAQFVSVVLAETEDVWTRLLSQQGKEYPKPTLVLFRTATQSGCGSASSATGPFYCPGDQKLYIDLSFFDELQNRFGAKGDFPMAYVVAHEVGHHVQNLLGIADKMANLRERLSEEEFNKYSVKMELQADFFAGVWAHYEEQWKHTLDPGDIDEALNAASAIGDDRIQMQSQGYIVPDAFTHGTSQQRSYWFKKGYQTGDINQGNTFANVNM